MVRKVRSSPLLPAFFDCLRARDLFAIYLVGFPKIFEELRKRIRDKATQFRLNKPGNMSGFGGNADIHICTMMRNEVQQFAHS
ncbi:hypothetical protein WH43_05740 [Rheinheimera sp. KL1]|nr:hypothetical protein WH43_05740 [Rheinheimera sp. KL1]